MVRNTPTPFDERRLSRRTALAAGVAAATVASLPWASPRTLAQPSTPVMGNDARFPPSQELALTRIVGQHLGQGAIPGALVGVWGPGRGTWVEAMGIGDLTTAVPITTDDHVRIASITKTFTGTVVLQLVEEGKLSLDDTLASFVPGIANGEHITIHQLLNMTAGVFDYIADPVFDPAYQADPEIAFSPEEALAIMRQHPADFAPGTQVHYSNSNTYLLGLIIEQVTGQSAGEAITDRIIGPLGLSGTSFPTTPEMPTPYAHGYDAAAPGDPLRDVTRSNPAVPWTAGAIVSTLADLHTWARVLANGTLLSPELQRERLDGNPMPGARPGLDLRYGLGLVTINGLIGHSGGIAGYGSWMLHDPDDDATLVIVATRTEAADPLLVSLLPVIFPQRFPTAPATPVAGTPVGNLPVPG
jgi:D-alanyl-D-alanine carboxypeptidase